MKLHLGCGRNKKAGYINADISKEVNPDLVIDLERKLPFKDNTVDEIVAEHVLEHVNNLMPLLKEFYRVCKDGAIINIRVPYFAHESAFSNITHVRFFTYTTFDLLDESHSQHWQGFGNFKTLKKELVFRPNLLFFLNYLPFAVKIYQNFFCYIFPAKELRISLQVVKKR